MSAVLADKLAKRLEESFATNVHNLPMLRDPEPLLKRLKDSYMINVDLMEELCARRIFAVAPFVSTKRREHVLKLFPTFESVDAIRAAAKEQQKEHQTVLEEKQREVDAIQPIFDGQNSPPKASQKDVDDLRETILSLQNKLEKSKIQLKNNKQRLKELTEATELCKMALETSISPIHDTMTALAMGASSLDQVEEQGCEYINEQKRLREENDQEIDVEEALLIDVTSAAGRKRTKMTLDERCTNDFGQQQQQGVAEFCQRFIAPPSP
ncbi:hypothetical protein ACA910_000837 [Epithemia clementina (nom. ined.)]